MDPPLRHFSLGSDGLLPRHGCWVGLLSSGYKRCSCPSCSFVWNQLSFKGKLHFATSFSYSHQLRDTGLPVLLGGIPAHSVRSSPYTLIPLPPHSFATHLSHLQVLPPCQNRPPILLAHSPLSIIQLLHRQDRPPHLYSWKSTRSSSLLESGQHGIRRLEKLRGSPKSRQSSSSKSHSSSVTRYGYRPIGFRSYTPSIPDQNSGRTPNPSSYPLSHRLWIACQPHIPVLCQVTPTPHPSCTCPDQHSHCQW